MAQVVLGSLNRLPDQERQVLVGTLRTWLACGGSAEDTAKALSCHPSTVRYRLNLALQPLLRRVTESELGCEPNTHRGLTSKLAAATTGLVPSSIDTPTMPPQAGPVSCEEVLGRR